MDFGIEKTNDFTEFEKKEDEEFVKNGQNSIDELVTWAKVEFLELVQLAECIRQFSKLEIKIQAYVMKHRLAKSDLYLIDESLSNEKFERKRISSSNSSSESITPKLDSSDFEISDSIRDDPS